MAHVEADRDSCVASGSCAFLAPDVFDQDDDGLVVVTTRELAPQHRGPADEAVAACPAAALRIVDAMRETDTIERSEQT